MQDSIFKLSILTKERVLRPSDKIFGKPDLLSMPEQILARKEGMLSKMLCL
jgi:hypothetical protein